MKAFIKTACVEFRKFFLSQFDHFHGYFVIGFFLHDLMMQYEPMVVFHNADAYAQFDGHTRFAFTDPFGMRLK